MQCGCTAAKETLPYRHSLGEGLVETLPIGRDRFGLAEEAEGRDRSLGLLERRWPKGQPASRLCTRLPQCASVAVSKVKATRSLTLSQESCILGGSSGVLSDMVACPQSSHGRILTTRWWRRSVRGAVSLMPPSEPVGEVD